MWDFHNFSPGFETYKLFWLCLFVKQGGKLDLAIGWCWYE